MSTSKSSLLTAEEAVAFMINLNYIPDGFTLLDMTAAFLEEAEVNYKNARIDRLSEAEIASLKFRMSSCKARHRLARRLLKYLNYELRNPESPLIDISKDSNTMIFESFSEWAAEFGFIIPIPACVSSIKNNQKPLEKFKWEDVIVKIYKDYRIGYKIGNSKYKNSSFQKIGLMKSRLLEPNNLGGIFIGFSQSRKFPTDKQPRAQDKTALSKLRNSLKKLTDIQDDPFKRFNRECGWIPRFKLIDDRRNADERAKEKTHHDSLDENKYHNESQAPDFGREDDIAQEFLDNNS